MKKKLLHAVTPVFHCNRPTASQRKRLLNRSVADDDCPRATEQPPDRRNNTTVVPRAVFPDQRKDRLTRVAVEVSGRLIPPKAGRLPGDCARNGNAWLLPARKLRGQMVAPVDNPYPF
jgi:hypothetical protein